MPPTAAYICIVFGAVMLCIATVLLIARIRFLRGCAPTRVEVIGNRETKDSDGHSGYAPVFRVLEGPQKGLESRSVYVRSAPAHQPGEMLDAWLDPVGQVVHTRKTLSDQRFLIVVYLVVGAALFLLGLFR